LASGFWARQRNAVWTDEIRFWRDAAIKSPESVRPHNNLGIALALKGRYEEGIAACRHSLALSAPGVNTAEAYNNITRMYHELGDNEKALEYGQRTIQIDPDLAEARLNLGKILLAENRLEEAVLYLAAAVDQDPYLTPAYTLLARAHYQKTGKTGQAADFCRRALEIDPEYLEAASLLGSFLQHSGDPRAALIHLQRVLDSIPDHPQANLNAGIAFNKLKQPEQAIRHLARTVAAMPDHARARTELGSALMAVNRLDEARMHLIRSLDLSPDDPDVLTRLAMIMEQQQNLTAAAHYYRKALAIAPDSPVCLNRLAMALAKSGRFEEAGAALERLEKLLPEAPTVSYNLACLYARQNQPDKAIRHLEKAIKKGYNDRETLKTDPDLESIRNAPYYINLLRSMEKQPHDQR